MTNQESGGKPPSPPPPPPPPPPTREIKEDAPLFPHSRNREK